ncbi:MAG: M56 family metallopeptidase, partial [bacterium]
MSPVLHQPFLSNDMILWLSVLLDTSIKSLVVLGAAAALSFALRRAAASARHLVWTISMVILISLPVLSLVSPSWQIPILPRYFSSDRNPEPIANRDLRPHYESPALPESIPQPIQEAVESLTAPLPSEPQTLPINPPVEIKSSAPIHWSVWVLIVWSLGVAIVLGPMVFGMAAIARTARRAKPVAGGPWRDLLRNLSRDLNVGRNIRLLQSRETTVPMTWGLFRPVLLLPSNAADWSAERLRVVLLHELAHVKRCDWVTQILAQIACAIYWFNPLAWFAARHLRTEGERACDDWVLIAGHKASDYAGHLLEIVRTLRASPCSAMAAVAMARPSRIENRLLAILDATRNRKGVTRLAVFFGLAAMLLSLLPLASIQVSCGNQGISVNGETQQASEWRDVFSNGITAELIGVSYHPSKGQPWWKPDGSPLHETPYHEIGGTIQESDDILIREFALRLGNIHLEDLPTHSYSTRWEIVPSGARVGGGPPDNAEGRQVHDIRATAAAIPKDHTVCTVRFGIAAGPWETVVQSERGRGYSSSGRAAGGVTFSEAYDTDGETKITIADDILESNHRVVAIDKSGQTHSP